MAECGKIEVNRLILKAMVSIGSFTLLVRVLALVKEFFVAGAFGTSAELDAFIIATLLPLFGVQVLGVSFAQAFLPAYITETRKGGEDAGKKFAESALVLVAVMLGILVLIIWAASDFIIPVISSGFSDEKRKLAISLQNMLLPLTVLGGFSSVLGAVLNARGKFGIVSLAPGFAPALSLALLLLFFSNPVIEILVAGLVAGSLLEILTLFLALRRGGRVILPRWHGMSEPLRETLGQYFPAILGSFIMAMTSFTDQAMAAMLPSGSVAQLSYGVRIVTVLSGVLAASAGTAILPYYSSLIANNDITGLRLLCISWIKRLAAALIPLSALVFILSEDIIRILYERGSFSPEDTEVVSLIQSLLAIQIPFYVISIMGVRLLTALRKNHLLIIVSTVNVTVNVAGNLLFMHFFGVAGIALSTSIVYAGACILVWFLAVRSLREREKIRR